MNEAIQKTKKLNDEITKLRLKMARKTKQKKHWLYRLKDISDAKSKSILEIEKNKKEVECIKKTLKALFNTIIDSSLFALLFFNALSTLISNFVANEIVVAC